MIICLSGFVIAGRDAAMSARDLTLTGLCVSSACAAPPPVPALPSSLARLDSYGESHRQLLHQFRRDDRSGSGSPPCPLRVRTLYACLGESEGELSFEPNQIITDVLPSGEPGWLRGTLDGRAGLVPANYVQPL